MGTKVVYYIQSGDQYLEYWPYSAMYGLGTSLANRAEYTKEDRAIEVAQFFNQSAVLRGVEPTFKVFREQADTVEVPLPKVDWLKDHEVTVESDETEKKPKEKAEVDIEE